MTGRAAAVPAELYRRSNPWPAGDGQPVLFILDARNDFERDILSQWVRLCAADGGGQCDAPQVCLSLADDRRSFDSAQLSAALARSEDTLVAPLRIAWLPSPDELDTGPHLRNLLFGDPRHPGAHRARRILARSPQRMHLLAGAPDSVARLRRRFEHQHRARGEGAAPAFADFVAQQAALVLDMAERRLQGGRYKVPRHVADSLLTSPGYNAALQRLAAQTGRTRVDLLREAQGYLEEMVSRPSTFWLDVYARFNRFCLGLGYEQRILYDKAALEKMRQLVRYQPTMLLWTHKTYLDGMVVPRVLFDNDFPTPHMFGGANMNFPGLGFLLHRAGAVFIKRSFQDNELYKITLRHYIGYLMEKRFPMSWSFEGTRSRTGKLMPPRYGLLKYVLEACHATDAKNIHIIPLTISYDLIRDVEEYATEQTGRSKGAESLRWFIGYVRSLARPMGKVYVDIGEPVVLPQAPPPDDRLALSKIAFEVAVQANNVTPVTFPSLVTMSLLGAAPRALTEEELVRDLDALLSWAEARRLRISPDFDRNYAQHMRERMANMIQERIVTRYDGGPDVVYAIELEQHPVASYYRNTIIHFFVNKALIELAMLKASEQHGDSAVELFWQEVDRLRDLFKFEFFYAPSDEFHRQIRTELARYDDNWETLLAKGAAGFAQLQNKMLLVVCHVTLLSFAEAYSVVAEVLVRLAAGETLEETECINRALRLGRQAYLQRRISSPASIGKQLFRNGFQLAQHRQLTGRGDAHTVGARLELAREIRDVLRRIELFRAIGVARHGMQQDRREQEGQT
ncbi:MAG: glycerol-3-phosphate 1-O-acyltransferase [Halioglobus sp.]|nr:glycerol-3-phosphate 1-O-acyltransferase [Halioglobus sp.]